MEPPATGSRPGGRGRGAKRTVVGGPPSGLEPKGFRSATGAAFPPNCEPRSTPHTQPAPSAGDAGGCSFEVMEASADVAG